MKTRKTLSIILTLLVFNSFSQQSILLYTNFPSSIKIMENNKLLKTTPIWERNAGGYIIDVNNEAKTLVAADGDIFFKLSNDNKTTKKIRLPKGGKLSIYKCLNSEEYCCERLTTKQQSATKKIYAVALMKKSAMRNKTVSFNNLTNEFINKDDVRFSWKTDSILKSISIYDVVSMDVIYEKEFNDNIYSIDYNTIKKDLKQDLKQNNKYVLKVITRNLADPITELKESSYGFNLKSIAFENKQYYFSTFEAVDIKWNTKQKVKSLLLIEKKSSNTLKKIENFTKNEFILSDIIDKKQIKSGLDYILKIELTDGSNEKYPFVILLNEDENNDLRFLLE